jgi:hypothetical protein
MIPKDPRGWGIPPNATFSRNRIALLRGVKSAFITIFSRDIHSAKVDVTCRRHPERSRSSGVAKDLARIALATGFE